MPVSLLGKVAIVAGASRGCGRGIALALGDAGATVYVTGRTTRSGPKPLDAAPGTIEDTADEVTRRGGHGIPVAIDHTHPDQVEALFARVHQEQGRLDILACAVWGGNERFIDPVWQQPFWNQPVRVWDECMGAGPQAFWIAAHAAARIMANQRSGLIVAITEPMIEDASTPFSGNLQFDLFEHLPHYSLNRLVGVLARDAKSAGIAVIGLLPGFMKTERVEMHLKDEAMRKKFRYDLAESTEYTGRAVAALAADPNVLHKAGELIFVADVAKEYGFTDVDGRYIENFYRAVGRIE